MFSVCGVLVMSMVVVGVSVFVVLFFFFFKQKTAYEMRISDWSSDVCSSDLPDTLGIWDGLFLRPTVVCIFDRLEDVVTAVTPVRPRPGVSAAAAWSDARVRLADLVVDFERSLPYRREGDRKSTRLNSSH